MKKKQNKNILLLITFILTILQLTMLAFASIAIAFDLFSIQTFLEEYIREAYSSVVSLDSFLTSFYLETVLAILVNIGCAVLYFKAYKYRVNNPNFARRLMWNGIMQLLFSTYLAGIMAIISATIMLKKKPMPEQTRESIEKSLIADYKLAAMTEAVQRLKELREKGAISEEEYYVNLNKILEG